MVGAGRGRAAGCHVRGGVGCLVPDLPRLPVRSAARWPGGPDRVARHARPRACPAVVVGGCRVPRRRGDLRAADARRGDARGDVPGPQLRPHRRRPSARRHDRRRGGRQRTTAHVEPGTRPRDPPTARPARGRAPGVGVRRSGRRDAAHDGPGPRRPRRGPGRPVADVGRSAVRRLPGRARALGSVVVAPRELAGPIAAGGPRRDAARVAAAAGDVAAVGSPLRRRLVARHGRGRRRRRRCGRRRAGGQRAGAACGARRRGRGAPGSGRDGRVGPAGGATRSPERGRGDARPGRGPPAVRRRRRLGQLLGGVPGAVGLGRRTAGRRDLGSRAPHGVPAGGAVVGGSGSQCCCPPP